MNAGLSCSDSNMIIVGILFAIGCLFLNMLYLAFSGREKHIAFLTERLRQASIEIEDKNYKLEQLEKKLN